MARKQGKQGSKKRKRAAEADVEAAPPMKKVAAAPAPLTEEQKADKARRARKRAEQKARLRKKVARVRDGTTTATAKAPTKRMMRHVLRNFSPDSDTVRVRSVDDMLQDASVNALQQNAERFCLDVLADAYRFHMNEPNFGDADAMLAKMPAPRGLRAGASLADKMAALKTAPSKSTLTFALLRKAIAMHPEARALMCGRRTVLGDDADTPEADDLMLLEQPMAPLGYRIIPGVAPTQ